MTGLEHANGHRPDGLLDQLHPGLRTAPGPDREALGYDIDRALGAVLKLRAEVPPDAFTAPILGTVPMISSVAGLVTSMVAPPSASAQAPSI